jgi:origin recognition complex subunit 1
LSLLSQQPPPLTPRSPKTPTKKKPRHQVILRYYHRPQDTHLGRQPHHAARELFLGARRFVEPIAAVVRRARVVPPERFAEASNKHGADVFLCEYEYDETWHRFRRRRYGPAGGSGGFGGGGLGGGCSDDDSGLSGGEDGWGAPLGGAAGARHKKSKKSKKADEDDADYMVDAWGTSDSDNGDGGSDGGGGGGGASDGDDDDEYGRGGGGKKKKKGNPGEKKKKSKSKAPAAAPRFPRLHRGGLLDAGGMGVQGQRRRAAMAAALDALGAAATLPGTAADASAATTTSGGDAFTDAYGRLALAAVPAQLPCRDAEKRQLAAFVGAAVRGAGGGVKYVCGVPGTGKTACVMEVLSRARQAARQSGCQFVAVNCLALPSPQHVYSRLWERLAGQALGPARAREALEALFRGGGFRRAGETPPRGGNGGGKASASVAAAAFRPTLIVLDEIDMLVTRDQAVLYNLFEWPGLAAAGAGGGGGGGSGSNGNGGGSLSVIGISNTHDLDQRVLPRIASRLSDAKLVFHPYSAPQLEPILRGRLEGARRPDLIDPTAVALAARKVASETGDVRRALELLRRAVAIARKERQDRGLGLDDGDQGEDQATEPEEEERGGEQGAAGAPAAAGRRSALRHAVTRAHLQAAIAESYGSVHMQVLRARSLWEKALLLAVALESRAAARRDVGLPAVLKRVERHLCALLDLDCPPVGALQHAACRLASSRLLLADGAHAKMRLALNVAREDVAQAVRGDARMERLHQLL